jgi:formamidopyrimidine-DNA glycosylase
MPELPDVQIYVEALQRLLRNQTVEQVELRSPFLVRSFDPPLQEAVGKEIIDFHRQGKRIVWHLEGGLFLVFHLMIAGRFHWKRAGTKPRKKTDLAAFHFAKGTMMVTEAGSKKRASLHLVTSRAGLVDHDPGGLEVIDSDQAAFKEALARDNHTLKRALTDPHLFSGIGNAYSDEILHAAGLSPLKWTQRLADEEVARLHRAAVSTLRGWTERLRDEFGDAFPEKVTAFRPGMAVHGRFGEPCPQCGTAVQRIEYAENETNYCPRCQTGGKVLADRQLSRLLKGDWPATVDELEDRVGFAAGKPPKTR